MSSTMEPIKRELDSIVAKVEASEQAEKEVERASALIVLYDAESGVPLVELDQAQKAMIWLPVKKAIHWTKLN